MKKLTSGPSFFRRQLKIKGKTAHNGRGMYEMQYDCSEKELAERIEQMIQRHAEMFIVERIYDNVRVRVKDEYIDGPRSYFTLKMSPMSRAMGVLFVVY